MYFNEDYVWWWGVVYLNVGWVYEWKVINDCILCNVIGNFDFSNENVYIYIWFNVVMVWSWNIYLCKGIFIVRFKYVEYVLKGLIEKEKKLYNIVWCISLCEWWGRRVVFIIMKSSNRMVYGL